MNAYKGGTYRFNLNRNQIPVDYSTTTKKNTTNHSHSSAQSEPQVECEMGKRSTVSFCAISERAMLPADGEPTT